MLLNITIRPVTESDAAAITALSNQLGYLLSPEETIENIREVIADSHQAAFVACTNNDVIGWIHLFRAVRIESNPFAEIGGLVIAENYRKQGVGRLLAAKAKEWAKEKSLHKLRVRCNIKRTEAHKFYGALGFAEQKEQKIFELNV